MQGQNMWTSVAQTTVGAQISTMSQRMSDRMGLYLLPAGQPASQPASQPGCPPGCRLAASQPASWRAGCWLAGCHWLPLAATAGCHWMPLDATGWLLAGWLAGCCSLLRSDAVGTVRLALRVFPALQGTL